MIQTQFTVGVEEEFQIIDPETRNLRSSVTEILATGQDLLQDQLKKEMFQAMVEVGTTICRDVEEARAEVVRLRRTVADLVEQAGGRMVAAGTHPFATWQDLELTQDER